MKILLFLLFAILIACFTVHADTIQPPTDLSTTVEWNFGNGDVVPLFTTYENSSIKVYYPDCVLDCVELGYPAPPVGAFIAPTNAILTTPPTLDAPEGETLAMLLVGLFLLWCGARAHRSNAL